MAKDFKLVTGYKGYQTKQDATNTDERYLISGSQNVLVNDDEKVETRDGYTLFGVSASALTPIISSFEWQSHRAVEHALRSYDDELEVYVGTVEGTASNSWEKLEDGWTAVDFVFTTWWSNAEAQDLLLFVNGTANIYEWSGGTTRYTSATTNTITKTGSGTWAAAGFLTAGTREVRIKDSGGTWRTFAYTGGETTTTLTGVSPDPTAFTFTANALVLQEVRANANKPASGFLNDTISNLNNYVYVGSNTSREVYVSKNTDFTTYTFSSPRVPGEGALLTLDNTTTGFAPQEDVMYISAGKDDWYEVRFTLEQGSSTVRENMSVKKLKTAPQQSAKSQDLIGKIKNAVVFVSNEPTLDELGRVENINTPEQKPLSESIKPDFDTLDFTNGHIRYWKNQVFIALPAEGLVYIYDLDQQFWQPPQVLPVRRLAIIGGELYGHSSAVPETYKLFSGENDNENPIVFRAVFAYRNFASRDRIKNFDEYFTEGYIKTNTEITLNIKYDYRGATSEQEYTIEGDDDSILFAPNIDNSLGKESLGKEPLGSTTEESDDLAKFRVIHTSRPVDFYEVLIEYSSDSQDGKFQILSHGPNARLATTDNFSIKK